ncbi:MAG: Sapep family Mn(2+)-dependent dipeptidase [Clostridia bacterium]|nr:Sapep family Mn(2+)-dependent dipeptidase [Clostridia bacterium]
MQEKYIALQKQIEKWINDHKDEFVTELQGFARIPSVSRADLAAPGAPFGPDCRKVLDYALTRAEHYDFAGRDLDGCAAEITWGDSDNAIGVVAHLDVVPVGDGWKYPVFGATYLPEHDMMVGRGVSDNKSAAVMTLFAMRMLREFKWPMKHGVKLLCGMSEETGMQDMQLLRDKGYPFPKMSLVPDSAFPVNFAQKGSVDADLSCPCEGNLTQFDAGSVRNVIPDYAVCTVHMDIADVKAALDKLPAEDACMLTVTALEGGTQIAAHGRSGHAARPENSDNAIQRLCKALTDAQILTGSCEKAIRELNHLTADSFGESEGVAFEDEVSGKTTLVYGVAHLRDGRLHVCADSRYAISQQGEALTAALKADWEGRGFAVEKMEYTNPFYIPKDDARVTALQEIYHEITGREDQPYTMGGGTYSRVVPGAVTFGPSIMGVERDLSFLPEGHGGAHGRDEVVSMESLRTACMIYTLALASLDEIME